MRRAASAVLLGLALMSACSRTPDVPALQRVELPALLTIRLLARHIEHLEQRVSDGVELFRRETREGPVDQPPVVDRPRIANTRAAPVISWKPTEVRADVTIAPTMKLAALSLIAVLAVFPSAAQQPPEYDKKQ